MSLRDIDLNLVPVLQILLREKSVSGAAHILGLSQPAVSAALRRLRTALGDALLVRIGSRMALTPRALDLISPLDGACHDLESLFVLPGFDPARATHHFIVAAPDQATFLVAPDWLAAVARDAPNVKLRFADLDDRVIERMIAREVDFAVMPSFFMDDMSAAPLHFRPLYRDHSVALFRAGHPLADRAAVSEKDLAPWRMLSFHPGSDWVERKRRSTMLANSPLDPVAFVSQIALLPFLLLARDDYAIVSHRMAQQLVGLLPLAWRSLEFATPPIDVGIAWSHLKDADPAHRWFRETIVGLARTSPPRLRVPRRRGAQQ